MAEKTIEVVHYRVWIEPNGNTASVGGAKPPGAVLKTRGFTWRKIERDGSMTHGLCRRPAQTRKEADAIAARFAEQFGYRVIGGDE